MVHLCRLGECIRSPSLKRCMTSLSGGSFDVLSKKDFRRVCESGCTLMPDVVVGWVRYSYHREGMAKIPRLCLLFELGMFDRLVTLFL